MNSCRWITVSGVHPDAGAEVLAFHLAREMAARFRVLFWDVSGCIARSAKTLGALLPYRSSFSPDLLRNFLSCENLPMAVLQGPGPTDEPVMREVAALLKRSFDFLVALAEPRWEPEYFRLLDETRLALVVTAPRVEWMEAARRHVDRAAENALPRALFQVVLNRVPPGEMAALEEWEQALGRPFLAAIPLHHFLEDVRKFARYLEVSETLYRSIEEAGPCSTRDVKRRVHQRLLELVPAESPASAERTQDALASLLADEVSLPASREVRGRLLGDLLNEVLGLGPLEPLLKDPAVSEVMVNGPQVVFVEKGGRLFPSGVTFDSEAQLRTAIDRIVAPIGRRVDESTPLCDARLSDGSRVNIVLPPLALDGPVVTIRKFMEKRLSLDDLLALGALSPEMAAFLARCVKERKNLIISGGTGSGKTTLLNILSSLIAPDERIVTIEDAAELRLQQPHVVRLESRPANAEGQGAIPIRRLVINALRMRPDRIVVGECRGGEALDMLQAMNTGHDGSLTTLHANSSRDALGRLEALVLMAGMDLPVRVVREQIRSAVDVIVQTSRLSDGSRKIVSITELTGMEGDVLTTAELFRLRSGMFESTGLVPQCVR